MAENKKVTGDDREEIFVPRGTANDDPNLFVSVNGVNYLLPKGKSSRVPREVAEEIRRSQRAVENIDALLEAAGK